MADSTTESRSWRKRHPVLSRTLLYSLIVVALGVAAVIHLDGRNRTLRAELHAMDVVAAGDRTGRAVLRILDEKFDVPLLPADLRRDVHRARAFALAKGGDHDGARAELDAATSLNQDPVVDDAIRIERAQLLTHAQEPDAALDVLGAAAPPDAAPSLGLWWAMARASGLIASSREDEAIGVLRAGIDACPRPVSADGFLWLGGTPWRPLDVVRLATAALADLEAANAADWEALLAFGPGDFACAVHAARGLLAMGEDERAARAWRAAVAADPEQAADLAAEEADLGEIQEALK